MYIIEYYQCTKVIIQLNKYFFNMNLIKKILIFVILATFASCSQPRDPITGKVKTIEPNPVTRAKQYRDKEGGLFSGRSGGGNTNYEFSTSNVMWRASLEVLNFMPLQSVSYSGGLIITDWYEKQKESIKIEISFQSSDIAVNSIVVKSFKRSCKNSNDCVTTPNSTDFNESIKNKILSKARELSVQDAKKSKK